MYSKSYSVITFLIALTAPLFGCNPFSSDCETLSCSEILPSEEAELSRIGVTIPLFTVRNMSYDDENLPVIRNYSLFFAPAPHAPIVELQTDNRYGVDFAISTQNRLTIFDIDGNALDESLYPDCWDSATNIFGGNTMSALGHGVVPASLPYILEANLDCVPVAAHRLTHEYTTDDGRKTIVTDRLLSEIQHWRSTIRPLICRNQAC